MTRNPSSNGKKLKSKDVITRDEKNPTKKSSNRRKGGDDEPKKKKGSIPKKNDSKKGGGGGVKTEALLPPQSTRADAANRDRPSTDEQKASFAAFLGYALNIGVNGILQEYHEQLKGYIPPNVTRQSFDSNMEKNRYKDVICIDNTRVTLRDWNTDYIHANFIRGEPLLNTFICTQGPMMETVKDFWRMVIQENVGHIIMLCETVEQGREKCQQYWPREEGCVIEWPGIIIRNKTLDNTDPTVLTATLELEIGGEKSIIKHSQWRTWPDRSVPQSVLAPFRLLAAVRHKTRSTVVHCSAGVGRTGTVVALEVCLQQILAAEQNLNVIDVVKKLRGMRMHCIQTDLQLVYIYKCLVTFATQHHVVPPEMMPKMQEFDANYQRLLADRTTNEGKQTYEPLTPLKGFKDSAS